LPVAADDIVQLFFGAAYRVKKFVRKELLRGIVLISVYLVASLRVR
jgi:hypothetical protein